MERYVEASKPFDAIEHLRRCSKVRLFFQFGAEDELISQEYVRELLPYGIGDNLIKIYESGSHYQMFLNPDARRDRLAWIEDQLLGEGGLRFAAM